MLSLSKNKKKSFLTDKSRQQDEYGGSCLGFTTQLFKFGVLEWDVTMLNEEGVHTKTVNFVCLGIFLHSRLSVC